MTSGGRRFYAGGCRGRGDEINDIAERLAQRRLPVRRREPTPSACCPSSRRRRLATTRHFSTAGTTWSRMNTWPTAASTASAVTRPTRSCAGEPPRLMPYQPHYQTVDYNPLNGGVARYFAPILDDLHQSQTLAALLRVRRPGIQPDQQQSGTGISNCTSSASRRATASSANRRPRACTATASTSSSWS